MQTTQTHWQPIKAWHIQFVDSLDSIRVQMNRATSYISNNPDSTADDIALAMGWNATDKKNRIYQMVVTGQIVATGKAIGGESNTAKVNTYSICKQGVSNENRISQSIQC